MTQLEEAKEPDDPRFFLPPLQKAEGIFFRVPERGLGIRVKSPSKIAGILRRAFGEMPIRLNPGDTSEIHGIQAADSDPVWGTLLELLRKYDTIEVWATLTENDERNDQNDQRREDT